LDSVEAGAGINDNGSGSSMNLELAVEFAKTFPQGTQNKVRFCWWGAEELGLLGSIYYVKNLTTLNKSFVACNLNFDMLASPNYIRGVYDGANAVDFTWVQNSSAILQRMFYRHFSDNEIVFKAVPFTGRSDYFGFIDAGIPAGGLDTGAEVVKSVAEREVFDGIANIAYDPCYHQSCDSLGNADLDVLMELSRAAAHVVAQLATTADLPTFLGPRIQPPQRSSFASSSLSAEHDQTDVDASLTLPPLIRHTTNDGIIVERRVNGGVPGNSWYPAGINIPASFDA